MVPSPFVNTFSFSARLVGLDGFEPSTSRLSGVRSNQTELQAPGIENDTELEQFEIRLSLSSIILSESMI